MRPLSWTAGFLLSTTVTCPFTQYWIRIDLRLYNHQTATEACLKPVVESLDQQRAD
jgi:hypothetical protein